MSRAPSIPLASAALLAAALAGCGGSGPSSPQASGAGSTATVSTGALPESAPAGTPPGAPAGSPGTLRVSENGEVIVKNAASLPVSKQYALFAKLVNLRPSDLPGYQRAPHKRRGSDASQRGLSDCVRAFPTGKPVFKRRSERFKQGGDAVSIQLASEVEVARSAKALARVTAAQKAAFRRPQMLACLKRAMSATVPRDVSVHGVKINIAVSGLKFAPIEAPVPRGTDAAIGLTMKFIAHYRFAVRGRQFNYPLAFYMDALAFDIGKAQVSLSATGQGRPAPTSIEAGLVSTLVSRAVNARRVIPAID